MEPVKNPYFQTIIDVEEKTFRSKIFIIDKDNEDHFEYQILMQAILSPSSNLMPFGDNFVTKSWNARDQCMMIQVEYFEMEEREVQNNDF